MLKTIILMLNFLEKSQKYSDPKPFTKESLLYREIFAEFYSSHDNLITDYWMPNKTWEGCNVNDSFGKSPC